MCLVIVFTFSGRFVASGLPCWNWGLYALTFPIHFSFNKLSTCVMRSLEEVNFIWTVLHYLWQWDNMDKLREINWNFSNLEVSFRNPWKGWFIEVSCSQHWGVSLICEQRAFEEGGELYGKKVYMFGCTEREWLSIYPLYLHKTANFTIVDDLYN